MGSSQSAPSPTQSKDTLQDNNNNPASINDFAATTDDSRKAKTKQPPPSNLSGMDMVNYKCRKKKAVYSKCVSNFYNEKFLQGKALNQEEECGELFERYRTCYLKGIKREFFDKGQKKPKEGSVLAEEFDG